MKRESSVIEIVSHTEYIYDLLRQLKFEPVGVELTSQERAKLFDFLYAPSKFEYKSRYNDHYPGVLPPDKANAMSVDAFYNMNDDIMSIIDKIGVDPFSIFVFDFDNVRLDDRISQSLYVHGIARVGEYTIFRTLGHPISANSIELEYLTEDDKLTAMEQFKEGVPKFEIRDKNNNIVYYHGTFGYSTDTKSNGNINYKGIQLNEDYLNFDIGSIVGVVLDLDDILNFFESIENLLSNQLPNKPSIDLYRKRISSEELK